MKIKPEIVDSELVKVINTKELQRISEEIQEKINYKEPNLNLTISNSETKTLVISFTMKTETECPQIKTTFFNTTTKKNENFLVYITTNTLKTLDLNGKIKKLEFEYTVTLSSDEKKTNKKMTISDKIRCLIFTDESRIWNMDMANNKRLSYMIGYIYYKNHIVNMLNICEASRNLATMNPHEKNTFLRLLAEYFHQKSTENDGFYSYFNKDNVVLYHALSNVMLYYHREIQRLFVSKFYHERKSKNFLKALKFIGVGYNRQNRFF